MIAGEGQGTASVPVPYLAAFADFPEARQHKAEQSSALLKSGAQEKTRTSTVLPPLGPEPSASTNSATWAL